MLVALNTTGARQLVSLRTGGLVLFSSKARVDSARFDCTLRFSLVYFRLLADCDLEVSPEDLAPVA